MESFRPFLLEFGFIIYDVKKVDTQNNQISLDMRIAMTWMDGGLSCSSKVNCLK